MSKKPKNTTPTEIDRLNRQVRQALASSGVPSTIPVVTVSASSDLTNERVLTAGAGISITDGGAGSTVTIANTQDPAPKDASFVTLGTNGTLTNERVLTAGTGISLTDGGAGSTVTIASTITQGAPVGSSYLTLGTDAALTNERVLTAGTGISFTDGGAGSTLTITNTGAPVSSSYVTLGTDGTLTNERVLTAGSGISVTDAGAGSTVTIAATGPTIVVLGADVTNSNAVANTLADVTGLSFSVTAGQTFWFRFSIDFTSAATTTGARFTVNGPATTRLAYRMSQSFSATSQTQTNQVAYQQPAACSASVPFTTGNICIIEGFVTPSANGTLQLQFASEVSNSAIIAKAGSVLEWRRTL